MAVDFSLDKIPIVGTWFTNPDEDFARQQQHNMALAYAAARPELAQSWQNALMQSQTLAQPYQNAMAEMYGPGAQTDMSQANQTPMSPRSLAVGNPNDIGASTAAISVTGSGRINSMPQNQGPPASPAGQENYAAALAARGMVPQGEQDYAKKQGDYAEALRGKMAR